MKTTLQTIFECRDKLASLLKMIPHAQMEIRLLEIDQQINLPAFWGDPRGAAITMKERQKITETLDKLKSFRDISEFNVELALSFPQEVESLKESATQLHEDLARLEFQQMMSDPIDNTPAILSISAGAGGLESANFVSMLLRMYCRYADANHFDTEILDKKDSEEHSSMCIDTVSLRIEGPYAYGFLKSESGVHRLIRNSPFNANGQRHTSFVAVAVSPDIEDTIEIKIEEKDLEITAQTSGGPGGQNANKVASAIRIKHLPTGLNVIVRTERDQLSNKKTAFKILKAKLYEIEMKKRKENIDKKISSLSDVSFGSQIRTYTLTPYSLVKDHRTDYEVNNAESVLDGDLHQFILSYLRSSATVMP
jgi:peptide chain release factor 2